LTATEQPSNEQLKEVMGRQQSNIDYHKRKGQINTSFKGWLLESA
jgi:hypothetical protein